MAYAVIRTGGKQHRVSEGVCLDVEKLAGDVGETVSLDEVLLYHDGQAVKVGSPTVAGVRVEAEIIGQRRGVKIIVYKFRRRKNSRRKQGHRQAITRLRVKAITA